MAEPAEGVYPVTRSFEEAQQLWAAEQFGFYGYDSQDGDAYTVENCVIYGGYCETCEYTTAGYRITNVRTRKSVEVEDDFGNMVREISRFAEEG